MARQVVLLHGWSATSRSMETLAEFLRAEGLAAVPAILGDYLSMQDEVRVEDAAKRMHAVLSALTARGELRAPFDLIVHSTGALVARSWLARFHPRGDAPARNVVMLAPANFGSRLAALGRSMAARIYKTLFDDASGFETGAEMLHALELASPFTWDLAGADLFGDGASGSVYSASGVRPFVIVGVQPLAGAPSFASEPGSDGVVRAASANLNAIGATVDFTGDPARPTVTRRRSRRDFDIPFAVLPDRDHLSVLDPLNRRRQSAASDPHARTLLATLLRRALAVDSAAGYAALARAWRGVTEATAALAEDGRERRRLFGDDPGSDWFRPHSTVITRVRDDCGVPVEDYFLSFMSAPAGMRAPAGAPAARADRPWDADQAAFHGKALRHVHANARRPELRCFHIDRAALLDAFHARAGAGRPKALHALITAEARGGKVAYFAKDERIGRGLVKLHDGADDPAGRRLERWTPHLIDIVIPRAPDDDVFTARRSR